MQRIESRGALEVAHRILTLCSQVFRYAKEHNLCSNDPTDGLRKELQTPIKKGFAAIVTPKEIGALLRAIEAYSGNILVRTALQIIAYTFVRPSELRCATWDEFDLDACEWRIKKERMKMRKPHIVPLASQVVSLLKDLHKFTGHTKYLFPSLRTNDRPISDMTLLAGLRRLGYDGNEMTVHGFRKMASTRLNEMGFNRDHVEIQLAHVDKDKIRDTYNFAQYLPQRKDMMQEWANYLDNFKK